MRRVLFILVFLKEVFFGCAILITLNIRKELLYIKYARMVMGGVSVVIVSR